MKTAAHVIWTDPETGQQLIKVAEYDRPVWWLDIREHTPGEQAKMFARYQKWKDAQP